MKIPRASGPALLATFLIATVTSRGQKAPGAAPAPPELAIVVVEPLGRRAEQVSDFDRIDIAFTKVFAQRKWPVHIEFERFAANIPQHDIELRIFYQGIHREAPGEETFRAWMTLDDHGKKTDFGIVRFRYYPRAGELWEDVLEHALHGAAMVTADKIGPVLFPKTAAPGP